MKGELSFVPGQSLILAPKDQQPSFPGWLLASNGSSVGLVPANYIKILGLRPPQPQQGGNPQKQGRITCKHFLSCKSTFIWSSHD